ncbi:Transmembrane protein [Melia azedarach]|uniref:Transmembrane protein n=1 Tax=Melia azedarach TaxID=155640 RepID=A0ACC1X4M6_MELAZ|nr:Transmembrane protein [Melia azedarach]
MFAVFETYKNLILETTLSLSLTLLLTYLKIPVVFLQGLHTYIQPENLGYNNKNQQGVRAAIRRPSTSDSSSGLDGFQSLSSKTNAELKKRSKSKEKYEFDESKAQIFRLKLDEAHLQSRVYFNDYFDSFVYSFVAFSCLLLYMYLDGNGDSGIFANGVSVVLILGFVSFCKVFTSLVKLSLEKSASKKSEKQLSLVFGILGFFVGLFICSGIVNKFLDFDFGSLDGFAKIVVAVLMGCVTCFLYMPAGKSARSFWLGTNQIRCNLPMIFCGWFGRMILYTNYLLIVSTALLWFNPLTDILVNNNIIDGKGAKGVRIHRDAENLVGNVGMSRGDFTKLKLWCLLLSGVIQIVALRPNLQMYLNEAMLSWYQRLHASKVPDLDFSRAKVFLHNHYLSLVVLQFFAPAILLLLFLGLSQIDGNSFRNFKSVCGLLPCSSIFKEVALLMAWWVVFVWAVYTSAILILYRRGILYIS